MKYGQLNELPYTERVMLLSAVWDLQTLDQIRHGFELSRFRYFNPKFSGTKKMKHYQWDENKVLASDIYVNVSNGPISVIYDRDKQIDRDGFGGCYSTLLYFILITNITLN